MPELRDLVETVVLVMMENRSFDHMLGHLRYQGFNRRVDGLRRPLGQEAYENLCNGAPYAPFRTRDGPLPSDLPHERTQVATQLAWSAVAKQFTMAGFVEAYAQQIGVDPGRRPPPVGFFCADQVPVTSFLARNFAVCQRWFAPLPTSTQPNRTMALCGSSRIAETGKLPIFCDDLILDWLTSHGVRWRVYHDGLSFFALYPAAIPHLFGDEFRSFDRFFVDMQLEPSATSPQVVIVEPCYESAPHIGGSHPNDNHPPLAVGFGEEFLRRVYEGVTANPNRWAKTVLVLYYDEHGGFWDHVAPPAIGYTTRGDEPVRFGSTGPRVPAIVVSPLVETGAVCDALFDHTSVLQFLTDLFAPGQSYSADVEARHGQGISSLVQAITRDAPRSQIPRAPNQAIPSRTSIGADRTPSADPMRLAFDTAAHRLLTDHPREMLTKHPELANWRSASG